MPRILVADDNSNIQKMVALAFKNDGIEVVAVGNGDAAIRKLPEVLPDLILADVFMPVRNGYEVCEFVKMDSRFMHIPVVLLVGAFDPLDEREAQRVHADGVLKKPFVPPDPLISIVKALLAKSAGDRMVAEAVPVGVAAGPAESRASSSAPAPAPVTVAAPVHVPAAVATAQLSEELPAVEEFAAISARADLRGEHRNEHLEQNSAASVMAEPAPFPSIPMDRGSAVEEVNDPTLTVTASRDPVLGEPGFWKRPTPPEQSMDDAERDVVVEEVTSDHSWSGRSSKFSREDESAEVAPSLPAIEPIREPGESGQSRVILESIEPVIVEQARSVVEEFAQLSAEVAAGSTGHGSQDQPISFPPPVSAPEQGSATSFDAEESKQWPAEPPAPVLEFPRDANPAKGGPDMPEEMAAASELSDSIEPPSSWPVGFEPVESSPAPSSVEPESIQELSPEPPAVGQAEQAGDFAAVPDSDFDEDLASAGEPAPEGSSESAWPPVFHPVFAPTEEMAAVVSFPRESAREAAPAAAEPEIEAAHEEAPAPQAEAAAPAETPVEAKTLSAAHSDLVDTLVARIIERMQPQVIEMVTREILRPAVETLVRRELEKQ